MFKVFVLICAISLGGLSSVVWPHAQHARRSATDVTVQCDLESRLSSFSRFAESPVRIFTGNGIVRLEGRVPSRYDHDAIFQVVTQGAGTNKIVDARTVTASDVAAPGQNARYAAWLAQQQSLKTVAVVASRMKPVQAGSSN